jgi:rod shape-determining protein MreD
MNAWLRILIACLVDLLIRIIFNPFGLFAATPAHWAPDLLLITIVYITMTKPIGEAYFIAFLSGLVWDAVFLEVLFGTHALLFLTASICASRLRSLIWGQYAVSRLFLGVIFSGSVRFFEVIFWLSSSLEQDIPVSVAQHYILSGSITSGLVFMLIPWAVKTVSQRTGRGVQMYGRYIAA